MRSLIQELILAFRAIRKSPGFAAAAILSLALAVGGNAAIFALIDAVLFRPLPGISDQDRLVSLYHQNPERPEAFSTTSWREYEYYRDANHVFSGLAAYLRIPMPVRVGDRTESISGELVSENYFEVLGVKPQIGGMISGKALELVLSDRLWRERFGARGDVIGSSINVGGHAFTIVGVAPAEFRGVVLDWGERPGFWVPVHSYREASPALRNHELLNTWGMQTMLVNGRLRDGVTTEQAAAEMRALGARIDQDNPERARQWRSAGLAWSVRIFPLQQARFWPGYGSQVATITGVLGVIAAGVLFIACANIALLMLTRAAGRQREIAARLALGAGTWQIARLLLAEGLLLAIPGGLIGLIVAEACIRGLSTFPRLVIIPLASNLEVDLRVVCFTAALTALSCLAFSLLPLRMALRSDLVHTLRAGAPASQACHRFGVRKLLPALQLAATLVLVLAAGLFLRTLQKAEASEPFFRKTNLLLVQVDSMMQGVKAEQVSAFFTALLDRVRAIPGVSSTGLTANLPLSGVRMSGDIVVMGQTTRNVDRNFASPGYFQAAGFDVLQGRDFDGRDVTGAPAVMIVNEQMAKRFWNGSALGRQIRHGNTDATVIGIVADASRQTIRASVPPRFYTPAAQSSAGILSLVVRAEGNPMAALPALRDTAAALNPEVIIGRAQTINAYADSVLAQERLVAWCLGALATLALVLSAIGLYGTIAYSVSRRTAEIGVRMALGARRAQILRMVFADAGRIAAAGLFAGALISLITGRYVRSLLYGVTESDAAAWIAAGIVLSTVVLFASAIPALRASRVDPVSAIRSE